MRRSAQILVQMNQQLAALQQIDEARNLGSELVRAEQSYMPAVFEVAWAHYDAGDLLAGVGKVDEARRAFEAGRVLAARMAASDPIDPSYQRTLAEGHARLGALFQQSGEFPGAMGEYREADKIIASLAITRPEDTKVQEGLAFVRKRMGLALAMQREFPAAIAQQRQVVEIAQSLAKREASGTNWKYEHAEALRRLGETLLQADAANRTESLTLFQQALDVLAAHFKDGVDPRVARLRTSIEELMKTASR
jgi:tetratricopeptide (TPR) repeat protein